MAPAKRWLGRVAAGLVLVLAALVFTSALETGSSLLFAVAAVGLAGSMLSVFGIERPAHPLAHPARWAGWTMMLAFSLVPTSLLFAPALVVLLALPSVIGDRVGTPRGTGATGSRAPGPS